MLHLLAITLGGNSTPAVSPTVNKTKAKTPLKVVTELVKPGIDPAY